jgi:hypothetical protein
MRPLERFGNGSGPTQNAFGTVCHQAGDIQWETTMIDPLPTRDRVTVENRLREITPPGQA